MATVAIDDVKRAKIALRKFEEIDEEYKKAEHDFHFAKLRGIYPPGSEAHVAAGYLKTLGSLLNRIDAIGLTAWQKTMLGKLRNSLSRMGGEGLEGNGYDFAWHWTTLHSDFKRNVSITEFRMDVERKKRELRLQ